MSANRRARVLAATLVAAPGAALATETYKPAPPLKKVSRALLAGGKLK